MPGADGPLTPREAGLDEDQDHTTPEQREALEELRQQARQAMMDGQPEPPEEEGHGYDIPLPEDADGRQTHACEYLFVIYYDREAGAIAVPKTSLAVIQDQEGNEIRLVPNREPGHDDLWRASAEVAKDVESAQTANQTAQTFMQITQAMQQQAQVQRQQAQQAAAEAQRIQEAAKKGGR